MSSKLVSLVCTFALIVSEPAMAHSPIQGINNFYNGLLHPILVPAHLLLLISIGLLLGQQKPERLELVLGGFVAATFVGLVAAWFSIGTGVETLVLALSAVIGLLVAISPKMALLWCVVIALLAGLFLGIDSAQDELFGKEKLVSLFGSGVAIYFLAIFSMALADNSNKKAWKKIGIRIVGSWLSASSLLVLALSISPKL